MPKKSLMQKIFDSKNRKSLVCSLMSLLLIIYLFIFRADNIVRVLPIIIFMWAFYIFDMKSGYDFKIGHYIILFIISVSGILFSPLYFYITYYDKLLHFFLPIIGSMIIFHMIKKLEISFAWKLILTASILLSISLILEIVEYSMDTFLNMKLQGVFVYDTYAKSYTSMQNGLVDTITDMTCDFFGAVAYTVTRYIHYHRNRRRLLWQKN